VAARRGRARRHCLIVRPAGMQDVIDRYQGVHHRQMFECALTSICLFHKVPLLVYAGRPAVGARTYLRCAHIHAHVSDRMRFVIFHVSPVNVECT